MFCFSIYIYTNFYLRFSHFNKIKVYNPIKVIHFNIFRRTELLIVFDILNDIADCLDAFNSFIGDLEVEFFLKAHNEVYNVEGICAEVVLNVSALCNAVLINVELFYDQFLYLIEYHFVFPP